MSSHIPPQHDLITEPGVLAYLANTPFASVSVETLSGGNGNFAYRLRLVHPHEGHPTAVLKHAAPYVKTLVTMPFYVERQTFEMEALKRVKAWLPPDSLVTVPAVYHFDNVANVIILEDSGEDTVTLKEFFKAGRASSTAFAELAGSSLGIFIAEMHKWSQGNEELLDFFRGNENAKTMSFFATYGRLVSTVTDDASTLPALADPPPEIKDNELAILNKVAEELGHAMTSADKTFVMGDFWTGNIMVKLDAQTGNLQRLYLLDWELARVGEPGIEVGQLCAEVDLLRRFYPQYEQSATTLLSSFLRSYAKAYQPDVTTRREALLHWGTHLIVWTPRVPWGGDAETRRVVEDGIRQIVHGYQASDESLPDSVVGAFWT